MAQHRDGDAVKRWLSRRKRALIECAPISDAPPSDRAMRSALESARTIPEAAASLTAQQQFDQALATLVQDIPIPREAAEWFVNSNLIRGAKRNWTKTARHPAILATALALLVLTGIGIFYFVERLQEFPGSETAQRLLVFANTARRYQFDPLNTDAINLGDYFFMKSQLEHYDIPMRFADFRARGARVFDDEDGHRVAQVVLAENGVQFFLYPAERAGARVASKPERPVWRYVEGEGWAGAVQEREGVCFMIAMRGSEEELRSYLGEPRR
ncbi:MAG TPA: hypothetical protein VFV83_05685 [Chthoniobacteraceae bacterium]|nr:hypothetical protein [Chthoniobacteraceae bacterium]